MDPTADESVDGILAEIVARRLAGESFDLDAALAAHPDRADELRRRLADLQRLGNLWHDLSAPAADAPARTGPALPAGTRLGEFEIVREIGRGGMGVVYLARQEGLSRHVALKVIPPLSLSDTTRQRFGREARALAALSHPNIVPVYTAGECDGALYIAMEYVEGVTLAQVIDAVRTSPGGRPASDVWKALVAAAPDEAGPADPSAGAAPPARRLDDRYVRTCLHAVAEIAHALDAAHHAGIIHRDVKPGNIIIQRDGHARLLDFGIAAVCAEPHVTVSGEFVGTPNYVAPEQATGRGDRIGPATDVYGLGAALYECLTLRTPFEAPSLAAVLVQVVHAEAPSPRAANPRLPRDVETIVVKSLSKDTAARYPSMAEFADDVEHYLAGEPIHARRVGWAARLAKRMRRNPVAAALAAAIVVLAGLAAVPYLLPRRPPATAAPPPPSPAPVSISFLAAQDGTVVHDGHHYRTGQADYSMPQLANLPELPGDKPVTLRFHADLPLAAGAKVLAAADIRTSAGTVVPKDTPGTVTAVHPHSGRRLSTGLLFWDAKVEEGLVEVRWDGLAAPQAQRYLKRFLRPARLAGSCEVVTVPPGSFGSAALSCCYFPRSAPFVGNARGCTGAADGTPQPRRDQARALGDLLLAVEAVALRAAVLLRAPISMELNVGLDGRPDLTRRPQTRWDWRFDLCGIRLASKGAIDSTGFWHSTVDADLPFGPGGGCTHFTLKSGILAAYPAAGDFDYPTALRRHLIYSGIEVTPLPRRPDDPRATAVKAVGVLVVLHGRTGPTIPPGLPVPSPPAGPAAPPPRVR